MFTIQPHTNKLLGTEVINKRIFGTALNKTFNSARNDDDHNSNRISNRAIKC